MGQYRNRKTACPFCKKEFGNSGYKNHVAACEKKHNAKDAEYKEIQNHEEEAQDPTQTQIQTQTEQEDDEMTDTEPQTENVILIHHGTPTTKGNTNTEETGTDRFFDSAGKFLDKYGEIVAAILTPVAVALSEKQQQQTNPEQDRQTALSTIGEDW